jgi:hypothetical protein
MVRFPGQLVAAVFLGACASPVSSAPAPGVDSALIAYTVGPEMSDAGEIVALRVTVSFPVDGDGATDLHWPAQRAGLEELWRNFDSFAIDGGQLTATDKPQVWTVSASPGTRVTVSYRAKSSIEHAPTAADGQPIAPWIMPDWLFVDTVGLIARPDLPRAMPATFAWRDAAGLTFVSDLERHGTIDSGATMQDMRRGVLLAGRDIRVLSRGSVRMGLYGEFSYSDEVMLDGVTRALAAIRDYWDENPDAPYTVAIAALPIDAGSRGGFSGASLDDGFLATISGDVELPRMLSMLFAHEVLHAWCPAALGDARVSYGAAWFGEGFTDYFARILMLRAGVISLEDYADLWNDELSAYMASPARNYSNQKLTDEHGGDFHTLRMPYMRGAMLAAMWDRRLRDASAGQYSLDDVIREQLRRAAQIDFQSPARPGNGVAELFAAVATEFGLDLSADLEAYVERGDTIFLPPGVFGRCLHVEQSGNGGGAVQRIAPVEGLPGAAAACDLV